MDKLLSWGDATATTSTAKRDSRLSPNGEDISRKNGSASGVGCVPRYKRSPFPISTSVNSRFILWYKEKLRCSIVFKSYFWFYSNGFFTFVWLLPFRDGDITELEVDAITNVTNESLDDTNIISERILAKTGDQVKHDLMENIQREWDDKAGGEWEWRRIFSALKVDCTVHVWFSRWILNARALWVLFVLII